MPKWSSYSENEWWISCIFKKFIWNLRLWETKWQLTTVFYKCSLTALGGLGLSLCRPRRAHISFTALPVSIWVETFAFGDSCGTPCWGSDTGMDFGGGAHVWFLECSWVLCTSVALTVLIPWSLLSESVLILALTIVLRQRTWDPVRGAEAQWQWMAHRPGGAERKKP